MQILLVTARMVVRVPIISQLKLIEANNYVLDWKNWRQIQLEQGKLICAVSPLMAASVRLIAPGHARLEKGFIYSPLR